MGHDVKEIVILASFMRRLRETDDRSDCFLPLDVFGIFPTILRIEVPRTHREPFDIRIQLHKFFSYRLTGLETLKISMPETDEEMDLPAALYTPSPVITPKSLTLRGILLGAPTQGSPHLEYLELREVFWQGTTDMFFRAIKDSPNLQTLVLADFYSGAKIHIGHVETDVTPLPSLAHLELGGRATFFHTSCYTDASLTFATSD
ncbi:hypothetical protein FRB93_005331 [Tulasnella sp. JGI-2019a]|nr:hypothetical protein FRB93_005331 [Tulasnella sp. JGI-2019a]